MYDKYPVYDVPQNNLIQRFFAQSWRAIMLEIALTIVLSVAAGFAFDVFDPLEKEADATAALVAAEHDEATYYGWRAYAAMMAGEYDAAQRDYLQLLRLEPADYDAHNGMCWAYGELGHFTSAMGHCNIALALAASAFDRMVTLENRCWLRVEMGQYEAATGDCLAALNVIPACDHAVCALAHYNLGRVRLAQGQLDRAVRHFNLAVYIGSSYPDMYLEISEVYATLGYAEAAQASFSRYAALLGVEAKG